MDLTTAQNIFAVRLYEWSQRDFIRELEEGCPLLSTVGLNDRWIAAFVPWNETLSSKERKSLAIALTRRCHENAARLKGEILTEQDKRWYQIRYDEMAVRVENLPPLATADRDAPNFEPRNPERCLDELLKELSPAIGKSSRRLWKVQCTKKLGDWKIVTDFVFHKSDDLLSFEYQFIRSDSGPVKNPHPAQGPFPRTMLFFYGLSFSSARVPSRADEKPMAKTMAKMAEYFVAQADPLFDGLGVND